MGWEVTVPEDASGACDLTATVSCDTTTHSASLILMTGDGRDTPGRVDEVRACSRALFQEEVTRLYQGSIGQ